MPVIQLRRVEGRYHDMLRSYKVLIDGRTFGTIQRGETQSYAVADGVHKVQLRIDWCGSPVIDVQCNGMDAVLECGPASRWGLPLLFMILKPGKWIWLRNAAVAAPQAA